MRRLVVLLLVPILLTLALAKAAVGDSTPGGSAAANGSAVEPVTICGTLFCVGGKTFYPYGASFYSSTQGAGILSNPAAAISCTEFFTECRLPLCLTSLFGYTACSLFADCIGSVTVCPGGRA